MSRTENAFKIACEIYQEHGVDPVKAIETLKKIPVSLHAWQGDDVVGFENFETALTGGCQVTGNVFENNTANGTAVLYYVKGAGCTLDGNMFVNNNVNCNSNGATVYMGFTENNVVTNNVFKNNAHSYDYG